MGCDNSNAYVQRPIAQRPAQNYNNNSSTMFYQMQNTKPPKFLNPQQISQQQKDTLWKIIQTDSLRQFAYFVENQRIPSNVQVGSAGMYWNFAHFCCRWNAFECLYYIIKRIYSENSSLLRSLLNQQTIQGFTPMHVAIQWGSLNCFHMLLDCGGIDLSYTDKNNNDVFAKANLFKRSQMLQILERFKAANALMILVQTQKVRGFKDYSQQIFIGQIEGKKQFRISNERIAEVIDTINRLNRPSPPFVPPIQNNPTNFQNFNNNMKAIQTQKYSSSQSREQKSESINMQKILQQRRFQQQQLSIKKKNQEEIKRSLQKQRMDEQRRIQQEQTRQITQEKIFQHQQLVKIEREKQLIRKNIEAMYSNNSQGNANYTGHKTKMTCPQDIRPFYEAALANKTRFVDQSFPAELKTIGNVNDFKFGWSECVWLRPQQIFAGSQYEVFDGISPEDVKQGALGVCYYLAFLSSIAENQKRIKRIFRFYDKELGFYALQFYLQGKPLTIIVDDQIPCLRGTNEPLFAKPRSAETWVMIFEKAWVKMFGSYLAAQKMAMSHMFENVLPAPCRQYIIDVSKIEATFDKFVEYDKLNYIMTASSTKSDIPGIVQEHAYSLIGAYNFNGVKLCKVRNPWGKTQYAGMYSETSSLWTPQLRDAVGFQPGDDGIFYLTPTQLQQLLPVVTIGYYKDSYDYSFLQIHSKSDEQLYYVFNVKKAAQIAIKVTQQNERFNKNMQYQNAPIRLEIWKLGENYDAKVISQGQPSSMYHGCFTLYSHEDFFQQLEAGRYLIRLKVLYDRTFPISTRGTMRKFIRGTNGKDVLNVRDGKCVLSIYGPQSYVLTKLSTVEAQKYMKNAYHNFIIQSPKASERLRSVGQDLVPTVIAKDCNMRNQIIYLAENHLPSHSINFKFQFSHQKFRNCSYKYNVDKEKQSCEWVIQPKGWNICTLQIDCPFQDLATDAYLQPSFKIVR